MSKKKLPLPTLDKVPVAALQPLQEVISDVTSYLKVAQEEETKRTDIRARQEVALEAIRSRRDLIMKAIEFTFAERAAVINKQFEALDHALASGNTELAIQSMHSMTDLVKTSPIKALQDVQNSLQDGSISL